MTSRKAYKPLCKKLSLNVLSDYYSNYFMSPQYDHQYVTALGNRLIDGICSKLTHVTRNGDLDHTYLGCVNLSFACVEGESLLMALKDIALSSGR